MAQSKLKWQQIFDSMEARIRGGQLQGKLPSYAKLSDEYETSVITISRVIRELERRGYVVVKPKSGVTVEPLFSSADPLGQTASLPPSLLDTESISPAPLASSKEIIKRIALVLPVTLADPYWASVADGALYACRKRNQTGRTRWRLELDYGTYPLPNHSLYIENHDGVAENLSPEEKERAEEIEKQVIWELCDEVDGLMFAPRFVFDTEFYLSLFRRGKRILTLDNKVPGAPCVASNNRRAAYKGVTFLLLGLDSEQARVLRRVATDDASDIPFHLETQSPQIYVIGESPHTNTMRERLIGCQEAFQDAASRGYRIPQNWLRLLDTPKNLGDYQLEAYQATLSLIESLERAGQLKRANKYFRAGASVAIFALTDRGALGAYQALQEKGYADWNSDAQSVALLSYDNLWQSLQSHSISSLSQDSFQIGTRAAELLFDMPHPTTFFQPNGTVADIMLEVGLVQRDSTRTIKRP